MMGYYDGGMMGGMGLFMWLTWLIILVDGILLGAWLWKQIGKK